MKKLFSLLVVTALLASLMGTTAYAGGSAKISGDADVQQGKTHSYTITVTLTDTMDFIGSIKFSGVFSHDPIELDFHPSSNSGTTITKKVSLAIPANAELGSTGTITVTGQGSYLEGDNVKEYSVSKTLTATVIAPKPAATKKPSSGTAKPSATPTATPAPTEWDIAAQDAAALQAGGTLSVDVKESSKIPASLLSSLKEKKGKLTVNLSGASCTIDGASLAAIPAAESVDLAMTMTKDAALSSAAGGADAYQMHFAHSGQFPGPFAYSFKADANKPGDTLHLYYYYDQPGVLEGIQSSVVDDNGYVSFVIYHCSSYVVSGGVIEGAAGTLSAVAAGQQAVQDAQAQLADLETQLQTEKDRGTQLEGQLSEAQNGTAQVQDQLKEAQDTVAAMQAQTRGKLLLQPPYLIAAAGILVLLAVLFTMAFCRAGLFRRRPAGKHGARAQDGL